MSIETGEPDRFGLWLGVGFSSLLLAGGLFMAITSPKLRIVTANGPASGFLPLIIGTALALVAGLYLIQQLRALRQPETAEHLDASHAALAAVGATAEDEAAPPPEAGLKRAGAIVASLILLAASLEWLGFQLAMFVFLLFHLRVLGKQGWLISLIMAAVGSFGVFAVFTGLLRVTLPRADIPFLDSLGL